MTAKKRPSRTPAPPLAALAVAPNVDLWTDIILGCQTGTIRLGHRAYAPGPVMLCCPWASACVQAEIVAVRRCRLRQLTAEECAAAGFTGNDALLLKGMRRHYPNIGPESRMTFIRWENVQGTLIEQKLLVMAKSDRYGRRVISQAIGR